MRVMGFQNFVPNFTSNSFDCILSGWVLKYSNNKEKMINEMIRILKNEGIIAIGFEYFNKQTEAFVGTIKTKNYLGENHGMYEMNSVNDLTKLLNDNKIKFKILYEYGYG